MKVFYLGLGILIGVGLSTLDRYRHDNIPQVTEITEQIVLTIPKTQQEVEKQLLYMAASKAMLEEIHRQKILRRQ